jgi:hypothetical protein
MPREFYTEKDIEDLVRRGITSLVVNDEVALTELAYEKARRLNMQLLRDRPDNPPSAPVRPYLSNPSGSCSGTDLKSVRITENDLHQRIRSAVQARLGAQVDTALLDVIILRVLAGTGLK